MAPDPTILSLAPIALALVLSIATRQVILGLFAGLYLSVLMIHGPAPIDGLVTLIRDHVVPEVIDPYNAGVLVLLACIGGFVALLERSGGGTALALSLSKGVMTRTRVQLTAWASGILIFFSDLGTPLIVGPAFRSMFDRFHVSRQKLAYLIDTTASPVAILIPFIGWGVYIMSLLNQQIEHLDLSRQDYELLLSALPYQFYAWLALSSVPIMLLLRVEFGPMRAAEAVAKTANPSVDVAQNSTTARGGAQGRAIFIWLPLAVLGVMLFWILGPQGFPFERVSGTDFRAGLSSAYILATLTLVSLMAIFRTQSLMSSLTAYINGMTRMMPIAVMLLLAWAMSHCLAQLGADRFVAQALAAQFDRTLLPPFIFIVACLISFATGSSWGTFALIFPLALPAAVAMDASLALSVAAVLSGGLFGDHASPISETTILASAGADIDTFEHFRTQLPYALMNGALCLAGLFLASATSLVWSLPILLAAQLTCLALIKQRLKPS